MATRIAIQGEEGSYSDSAARALVGEGLEIEHCERFEDVFLHTAKERTEYCLVPIENSLSGSIHKNYDLLLKNKLKIIREINLRVEHNLIAVPGAALSEIRTVISHPVALEQCGRFFEEHPELEKRSAYDTSGSVREIIEKKLRDCAAIAGSGAAECHGGSILLTGIEDNPENFTRFFLLGREEGVTPKSDKTTIVFSFKNSAGALFKCLGVFALRDIDLAKIESRPIAGRPWEYLFYLDFLGNTAEEPTRNALNHLKELTEFLEVLGCYPRDISLERKGM